MIPGPFLSHVETSQTHWDSEPAPVPFKENTIPRYEEANILDRAGSPADFTIRRKPVNQSQPKLTAQPVICNDAASLAQRAGSSPTIDPSLQEPSGLHEMSTVSNTSSFASQLSTASSHLRSTYREARHFAGGLIHHPSESTKHFSILRHSYGLVFYQGTSTSVVISIFSDAPLQSDRTIWLQNKGWSGKTGMGLRSLVGFNGSWLNVTPTTRATAEQLKPTDERAWQRDIANFLRKAPKNIREYHRLRETIIVRIPVEAEDGYFRLVLCADGTKRVLCPSPVFRILSASTNPSSIRGASLSTLPLEVGAKVVTTIANAAIQSRVGPIATAVQNQAQQRMPAWVGKATTVYDASVADRVNSAVNSVNDQYNSIRDTSFNHIGGEYGVYDQGPRNPYPVQFVGRAEPIPGSLNIPTAILTRVPEMVLHRLHGFYFGWARFSDTKSTEQAFEKQWNQAVISVLPVKISELARVRLSDSGKRTVKISLVEDNPDVPPLFDGSQFEVRVLGFLRPHLPPDMNIELQPEIEAEAEMLEMINDIMVTQALLGRPAWGPDATSQAEGVGEPLQRVKSRAVEGRIYGQRLVDSIPLHRAGIRVPVDEIRDKSLGAGGFYIVR
ncbi:hypothetical protein BP6252_11888 [Coleophoma cylindrospora]|uniref:Riboflavin kinase n=1 Tax=Coleophoma cylindrospora TaxID=1849047 RepID=A0A3D8QKW3_9HELO|nr:hypothetical protein BP6252_11888 [Coleophoma cylindrospora]